MPSEIASPSRTVVDLRDRVASSSARRPRRRSRPRRRRHRIPPSRRRSLLPECPSSASQSPEPVCRARPRLRPHPCLRPLYGPKPRRHPRHSLSPRASPSTPRITPARPPRLPIHAGATLGALHAAAATTTDYSTLRPLPGFPSMPASRHQVLHVAPPCPASAPCRRRSLIRRGRVVSLCGDSGTAAWPEVGWPLAPGQEMPVLHAAGHGPKMAAAPTAHRPRLRYSSSPSSSAPRPRRLGITPIHRALRFCS